jgi:hypothetical protein
LPGESAPAGSGRRTAAKNRDKDLLTRCRFRDTPNSLGPEMQKAPISGS